ncbi:hypothetical protein JM93_01631 [Roseibium hamelinense]|uniref:Uncharacterized protein n=1 Tax=Roseibium hamelinense TaxID=150831 RepID=A0A562T8A2_9HYPH|nr:hypothetical protein JM93_01631 [Roseibium hamelinense]
MTSPKIVSVSPSAKNDETANEMPEFKLQDSVENKKGLKVNFKKQEFVRKEIEKHTPLSRSELEDIYDQAEYLKAWAKTVDKPEVSRPDALLKSINDGAQKSPLHTFKPKGDAQKRCITISLHTTKSCNPILHICVRRAFRPVLMRPQSMAGLKTRTVTWKSKPITAHIKRWRMV